MTEAMELLEKRKSTGEIPNCRPSGLVSGVYSDSAANCNCKCPCSHCICATCQCR